MPKPHVEYYKPLITECLLPEVFPAVNLYMKGHRGNYILYKTAEFVFSQARTLIALSVTARNIFMCAREMLAT